MEKINDMDNFMLKYNTESDFKEFVDDINKQDILMDFAYELYMKYGNNTIKITSLYVNAEILNLKKIISFFEEKGEFEKCKKLIEIQKK